MIIGIASSAGTQAATSFYCPQNHGYIKVGMTQAQVVNACGPATSIQSGNNAVTQQIPVVQLIYNNLNQGPVGYYPGLVPVYGMWSIPSGTQGINIQVNLINNRVSDITLNQAHTNAVSACSGGSFQVGDEMQRVFTACGSPDVVNNTYINQPVPKEQNPETWVFANLPYQPPITLTFVNGVLQSIN